MASIKAQKANAPKVMRVDSSAVFETDKVILGAGQGGTPAAGDTLDFLLPAGAHLADLAFVLDDCDTGAAFVFSIGYRPATTGSALTPVTNYFAPVGQTVGQAGGRLQCVFKPITFEEDVFVSILVGTAPAGIAANPEVHMIAGYNCQGPK